MNRRYSNVSFVSIAYPVLPHPDLIAPFSHPLFSFTFFTVISQS